MDDLAPSAGDPRAAGTAPRRDSAPHLPPPRGFWQRMGDRLAAMVGRPRAAVPPERSVAFTIAVIALGAKLAKADGRVAREEGWTVDVDDAPGGGAEFRIVLPTMTVEGRPVASAVHGVA